MDLSTSPRRPPVSSSPRSVALEILPLEIRYIIYRWLFPDLDHTIDLRIESEWGIPAWSVPGTPRRIVWRSFYRHSRHGAAYNVRALRQLAAAAALMATSHSIRQEVAPMIYSDISFSWLINRSFSNHVSLFGPWNKSLIADLWIDIPNKWNYSLPQICLCDTLKDFTGLQNLHIKGCDKSANQETTGTPWKSYHLQALRAIMKACPQLIYSYYGAENSQLLTVNLSSRAHDQTEMIQFEVDIEYGKWMDVFRKRRIARESEWRNFQPLTLTSEK